MSQSVIREIQSMMANSIEKSSLAMKEHLTILSNMKNVIVYLV